MTDVRRADVLVLSLVVASLVLLLVVAALQRGDSATEFERGRCAGWAENQGLVAAWDDEERCVIGAYPVVDAHPNYEREATHGR